MVVTADSDWLADMALRHRPNQFLLVDTVRWLGGEERFSGAVSSEEDVPVTHTRKQDAGLVLPVGLPGARRRAGPWAWP